MGCFCKFSVNLLCKNKLDKGKNGAFLTKQQTRLRRHKMLFSSHLLNPAATLF